MLTISTARTKSYGERAFSYQEPINWGHCRRKGHIQKNLKDNTVCQAGIHYINIKISSANHTPRGIRKSLFSNKHKVEDDNLNSFSTKKLKLEEGTFSERSLQETLSSFTTIIHAVDQLESNDPIVDDSPAHMLPTITGKHSDLNSISTETMANVLEGKYKDTFGKVTIVDCRYPYEYEGGHIKGAVNLYTKEAINSLLLTSVTPTETPNVLIIFHCEFSSERAPKMYRFLRAQDRELNRDHYPRLNLPEVYLLEGGYKAFYALQKNHCVPIGYMPMLHENHTADLRNFRVKSKSWSAGQKETTNDKRVCSKLAKLSLKF